MCRVTTVRNFGTISSTSLQHATTTLGHPDLAKRANTGSRVYLQGHSSVHSNSSIDGQMILKCKYFIYCFVTMFLIVLLRFIKEINSGKVKINVFDWPAFCYS